MSKPPRSEAAKSAPSRAASIARAQGLRKSWPSKTQTISDPITNSGLFLPALTTANATHTERAARSEIMCQATSRSLPHAACNVRRPNLESREFQSDVVRSAWATAPDREQSTRVSLSRPLSAPTHCKTTNINTLCDDHKSHGAERFTAAYFQVLRSIMATHCRYTAKCMYYSGYKYFRNDRFPWNMYLCVCDDISNS